MLEAVTSPAPGARELRQNSPFAGALDQDGRRAVLSGFAAEERATSHPATR